MSARGGKIWPPEEGKKEIREQIEERIWGSGGRRNGERRWE